MTPPTKRPHVRIAAHTWLDADGNGTPGIALRHNKFVAAHLTPDQAMQMADQLVDLAEQVERTPALPLTDASGSVEAQLPATVAELE